MSYILDALRRLEQDKERTRKGANPMEAVLIPDLEAGKPAGRMPLRWVGLGVILLAVAVGATYWITRRTVVFSTPQVREEPSPHLASTGPAEVRTARAGLSDPASSGTGTRLSDERGAPPTPSYAETARQPIVTAENGRASVSVDEETVSAPEETVSAPEETVSAPEETVSAPGERASLSRETFKDEVILPWEGEEIKINAIAWSPARDRRFALVNLKTVHEGDQLEGLTVVAIEEDGIVFEREGTKYRVSLGRR
jgi:cytoskeletal protein RodZ